MNEMREKGTWGKMRDENTQRKGIEIGTEKQRVAFGWGRIFTDVIKNWWMWNDLKII